MNWKDGLFPYQVEAVQFLLETQKAILRLDTGLGKTATCIRMCDALNLSGAGPLNVLVIAPAFLALNWKAEIEKWQLKFNNTFCVLSYAKFSKSSFELKEKYDVILCDEAHYLKAWSAKRTKNIVSKVLLGAKRVVFVTATPYVRSAEDLHPLFSVCEPGKWGKLGAFRQKYCKSKPNPFSTWKGAKIWYGMREDNAAELKKRSGKFIFFRKKQDVLKDLPEKLETDLVLKAPTEFLLKNLDIEEKFDIETGRISGGLSSVLSREMNRLGEWKLGKALEWAEGRERPVVYFCKHISVACGFAERLSEIMGKEVPCITGETLIAGRQFIVDEFQAGKYKALVCTIGSCGVGINLHYADTAFFVELPWSYTELKQCEDRLHRIGQKNTVNSYRLYAKGSVDDLVISQISQKLTGEEQTIGGWE